MMSDAKEIFKKFIAWRWLAPVSGRPSHLAEYMLPTEGI